MLIPGHIGLTLGAAIVVNRIAGKPLPTWRRIAWFSFLALVPDIMDKTIHFLYPRYPAHGVFHSVFLYSLVIIVWLVVRKQALIPAMIPAFSAALDIIGTSPGMLVYPLTGWTNRDYLGSPAGPKVMEQMPWFLSWTTLRGHYLVFEIVGAAIVAAVVIGKMVESRKSRVKNPGDRGRR